RKLPQAVVARICVQPSSRIAQIFARLFTCEGGISWFLPWRERMAASMPSICPVLNEDEGFPYGVSTLISFGFFRISGFSRPEPPMIATFIFVCFQEKVLECSLYSLCKFHVR